MAMGEDEWREKAQSCEARFTTIKDNQDRIQEDARTVLETFCARKKSDGSFDIDWEKFIERIGDEQASVVAEIIKEKYGPAA